MGEGWLNSVAMLMQTAVPLFVSASQPIHCLQGRKADALCLNPLNAVLAGLSAEMIVTAAR